MLKKADTKKNPQHFPWKQAIGNDLNNVLHTCEEDTNIRKKR
jgi:hypothetical protein